MFKMKCGLDIGSTLIKAAVFDESDGEYTYLSTKSFSKDRLIQHLLYLKVNEVALTGIGQYNLPFPVKIDRGPNPIQNELRLQLRGVRKLMEQQEVSIDNIGLVSIGTGTSYAHCYKDQIIHLPFGSFLGGGFIDGLGTQLMELDGKYQPGQRLSDMDYLAGCVMVDNKADLLIQDRLPDLKDTPQGKFMIASCGKLDVSSDLEQACLGIINCVASSIVRDILMFKSYDKFQVDSLVVVGSVITEMPTFRNLILKYCNDFKLPIWIPKMADYAGALGALTQLG